MFVIHTTPTGDYNEDLARYIIEQEQDIYPGNNTEYTHIYE